MCGCSRFDIWISWWWFYLFTGFLPAKGFTCYQVSEGCLEKIFQIHSTSEIPSRAGALKNKSEELLREVWHFRYHCIVVCPCCVVLRNKQLGHNAETDDNRWHLQNMSCGLFDVRLHAQPVGPWASAHFSWELAFVYSVKCCPSHCEHTNKVLTTAPKRNNPVWVLKTWVSARRGVHKDLNVADVHISAKRRNSRLLLLS